MSIAVSVGSAQALDGREAALQATHQALDRLGAVNISMGFVFTSHEFPIHSVLAGVSSQLGSTPLYGISTTSAFDQHGPLNRGVVVGLVASNDIKAQASWWQNYNPNIGDTNRLFPLLQTASLVQRCFLVAGDGFAGETNQTFAVLSRLRFPVYGCLASGPSLGNKSYVIAGNQAGSAGLATLFMSGFFKVSVGIAHGWLSTGHFFKITSVNNNLLQGLDSLPPAQAYSRIMGHSLVEWATPPLAELVRLYPLGVVMEDRNELFIHSPLRANPDGSFLMNTILKEGSNAFMMVGTQAACLKAVNDAVQQALTNLQGAKPVMALVFIDSAWQFLLESKSNPEINAINTALGGNVPIVGGYTFGQIAGNPPTYPPELYNQAIQVILLAE